MLITPMWLLLFAVALTITATATAASRRAIWRARLSALGAKHRMAYASTDRFDLTPRVIAALDVPGAASVELTDLLFSTVDGQLRCLFTVHYTLGASRTRKRKSRVGRIVDTGVDQVTLGPPDQPLFPQYQQLAG